MTGVLKDPVYPFSSRKAWAAWLAKQHTKATGVWLKIAKKESGIASVTHPEALDIAICYGWIDALRRSLDDQYFLQRFTPRTPRSKWSKINCAKAEALIQSGEMKPAGLREVERAKADGRWERAYAGFRASTVPDDLEQALAKNKKARAFFPTLSSQNRYAILYRLQDAKKPETRARRLEKFVAMLAEGKTIYPQ
jgi:uncharacterized protein YdeI (YjbR/CyaY-like superfamily)